MAIKVSLGKLVVDLDKIREYCLESGFVELPINLSMPLPSGILNIITRIPSID